MHCFNVIVRYVLRTKSVARAPTIEMFDTVSDKPFRPVDSFHRLLCQHLSISFSGPAASVPAFCQWTPIPLTRVCVELK